LAIITSGCETFSYYGQAIGGQWQILSKRRPIAKLLSNTNTPPVLRNRLQVVMQIRAFAEEELKLPADGHYTRYVDVERPFVVWNVHAAPELSLEAKSWWYPVVGRLDYRGYFSERRARRYAAKLGEEGFDVFVGGVEAYSTLGWFQDPVLNTFVFQDDAELAELLFHELAHQRLFISGDTDFNEAYATAVAEEGLQQWMLQGNDAEAWRRYQERARRKEDVIWLLLAARKELEKVYGEETDEEGNTKGRKQKTEAPSEWQRSDKQRVIEKLRRNYEALKKQWGGYEGYDAWFAGPLNNAPWPITMSSFRDSAACWLHVGATWRVSIARPSC
jgi:predicted aminopeptidase